MTPDPTPAEAHESVNLALETVKDSWQTAEGRAARMARLVAATVTYSLIVTIVMTVCLWGWQISTTDLVDHTQRQDEIDTCQDQAFADWLDDAIIAGKAKVGDLSHRYAVCVKRYGD